MVYGYIAEFNGMARHSRQEGCEKGCGQGARLY
jgi:hypothetical protein